MNKKQQIAILILIGLGIGYLLSHQNTLENQQLLIFGVARIIGTFPLLFKNTAIKFLAIPGILGIAFFLLLGFLPLYEKKPDGKNFSLTQNISYLYRGTPNSSFLIEESENGQQKVSIKDSNQQFLFGESSRRTLFFNSQNQGENNKLSITFPDGTIIVMDEGSKINIEKVNGIYTISKELGTIQYYKPNDNQTTLIKNTSPQEQKTKSDFIFPEYIQHYENIQKQYLLDQGGGIILSRPIYQRLSKEILDTAYSLWPSLYKNNEENYEIYKKIYKRSSTKDTPLNQEENRVELIKGQIKRSLPETRTFSN